MHVIRLDRSDTVWACADDDTIMRSALRAGLGFPYECNVGSCGNCRFELVAGAVEELRANAPALSERDRERGRRLGCQARPLTDCIVKLRLLPQYQSRYRPARHRATLTGIAEITHDIREFRFRLRTPASFLPGQYALLSLPGVDGDRAYSMANGEPAEWHFQVRRVPGGTATTRLFDGLRLGDDVGLDGPYGTAYLREEAPRDIVCLAGGSGLAPMMSIARAAAVSPSLAGRRIDFVYGGRTVRDICGQALLEGLPGFGRQIQFHPVVSGDASAGEWSGLRGFVHDTARELFGDRLAQCEVYFAGPPAMGQATLKMLADVGVPAHQIHFDQFY